MEDPLFLSAQNENPSGRSLEVAQRSEPDKKFELSGVIWGEQLEQAVKKLKSLTFFTLNEKKPADDSQNKAQNPESELQLTQNVEENTVSNNSNKKKRSRGGSSARKGKKRGGKCKKCCPEEKKPKMEVDEDNVENNCGESTEVTEPLTVIVRSSIEEQRLAKNEPITEEESGVEPMASVPRQPEQPQEFEVTNFVSLDEKNCDEVALDDFGPSPCGEKPNGTYTDIISKALEENPQGLTVSEIYDWISKRHPYYQATDDRWKNSVRHNLSISLCFKKGEKSKFGAGHVWTKAEGMKPNSRKKMGGNKGKNAKNGILIKNETDFAVESISSGYILQAPPELEISDFELIQQTPSTLDKNTGEYLNLVNIEEFLNEPQECYYIDSNGIYSYAPNGTQLINTVYQVPYDDESQIETQRMSQLESQNFPNSQPESQDFTNSQSGAQDFSNSQSGAQDFSNSQLETQNIYNDQSESQDFCNSQSGAQDFTNSQSESQKFCNQSAEGETKKFYELRSGCERITASQSSQ